MIARVACALVCVHSAVLVVFPTIRAKTAMVVDRHGVQRIGVMTIEVLRNLDPDLAGVHTSTLLAVNEWVIAENGAGGIQNILTVAVVEEVSVIQAVGISVIIVNTIKLLTNLSIKEAVNVSMIVGRQFALDEVLRTVLVEGTVLPTTWTGAAVMIGDGDIVSARAAVLAWGAVTLIDIDGAVSNVDIGLAARDTVRVVVVIAIRPAREARARVSVDKIGALSAALAWVRVALIDIDVTVAGLVHLPACLAVRG